MDNNKCIWNDFYQAKNDYMYLLYRDVRDPLNHYFEEIYEDCVQSEKNDHPEDDHKHTLPAFQSRLTKLSEHVDDFALDSIKKNPECNCQYKDELIKCIFLMQFRWMVVKPELNRTTDVVLPNFDRILKILIRNIAIEFKRYAYLFVDKQIDPMITHIAMQENINKRRELIWKVIYEVILAEMPMDKLYKLLSDELIVNNNNKKRLRKKSLRDEREEVKDDTSENKENVQEEEKNDKDTESVDVPSKGSVLESVEVSPVMKKSTANELSTSKVTDKDHQIGSTDSSTKGGVISNNQPVELNLDDLSTDKLSQKTNVTTNSSNKNDVLSGMDEIDLLSANSFPTVNVSFESPRMQSPANDQIQFNEINK